MTLLDEVLVAALALVVVLPFRALFVSNRVVLYTAGVVLLALVVELACRKLAASIGILVSLLALAMFVVFVVFAYGRNDLIGLSDVWHGVTGSWADLLTAVVPAVSSPELVVFPVIVSWAAAAVGLAAARTRSATLPLLGPLLAFTVALLFTGERGQVAPAVVAAVIALSLAVVLLRANIILDERPTEGLAAGFGLDTSGASLPVGQLRRGGVVLAVVTAGVVALAVSAPVTVEDDRVDLHDRYQPPFDVSDALSPLSTLRASLDSTSATPVFTVRFDGLPTETTANVLVRVATLDRYDGTVWTTDASFGRAGTDLPDGDPVQARFTEVQQHYDLADAYTGAFVPGLDRPVSVSGATLGSDRVSGMLVRGDGEVSGELSYDVTSSVATIDPDVARTAKSGNDPAYSRLSLPPADGWPSAISQFASSLPSAPNRYDQLLGLQDELTGAHFGYDPKARPGHSLGVLSDFLTASTGDGDVGTARIGYAEQFAAAFAVLARVEGLPSRVVVGYRVDAVAARSGADVPVLATAIHAWAEVHLNGVGWVTFDPTNPTPRDPVEPPPPETTVAPSESTTDSSAPPTTGPSDTTLPPQAGRRTSTGGGFPFGVLLPAAVVLLIPVLIVVARGGLRRRRKGHGSPSQRAIGAWHEARDRLRTHGHHVARGETIGEVAARAETSDPAIAAGLVELKPLVDEAIYAPEEPSDDLVAAAWAAEQQVSRSVAASASTRSRVRAAIDPRPLAPLIRRRG